jgi:hypothetical protein
VIAQIPRSGIARCGSRERACIRDGQHVLQIVPIDPAVFF